jgi:hypothetical protein
MARRLPTTVEQYKCHAKVRHASERMANNSAERNQHRTPKRLRSYRCPHCKGWHLTTRAQGAPK